MDQRTFRNALGCFPTGVTVVTGLNGAGQPAGVTVSSFTSLSLDPPLVLFCLDYGTSCLEAFTEGPGFCVHILRETQREISTLFARRGSDKFAGIEWRPGHEGIPVLDGCLARLECGLEGVHEGGDHAIIIGRVETLSYDADGSPLLYYRGGYARLGTGADIF